MQCQDIIPTISIVCAKLSILENAVTSFKPIKYFKIYIHHYLARCLDKVKKCPIALPELKQWYTHYKCYPGLAGASVTYTATAKDNLDGTL